jgi:hypothetical protein
MPDQEPRSASVKTGKTTSASEQLLAGDYLSYLLPRLKTEDSAPQWPPDVFGLCMALLCKAGAYCRILENWPPDGRITPSDWAQWIAAHGKEWRTLWPDSPLFITERWQTISGSWNTPVEQIADHPNVAHALLELCALADEASVGFWVSGSPMTPETSESKPDDRHFYLYGDRLRKRSGIAATLCDEIHPSRLCVLPKVRTPQNGLTSRSLSHHLAVCSADEIKPQWVVGPYGDAEELSLNLLLVPWPEVVTPKQFVTTSPTRTEMRNMPPNFGFFGYHHNDKSSGGVIQMVEQLHEAALAKMGRIDGIVLPEAALSAEQHRLLSEAVLGRKAFLVSGIGEAATDQQRHDENFLYVDLPTIKPLVQHKHHRWFLDQPQISQYGLGSRLYPEKGWWEHISLRDRKLNFIAVLPWLVMSVLICEDLARPDPVGDLVRAVGPNLVIALLMDGPQLKERWSARYATTLADDPGSSVLTVTSGGMCSLSRPPAGVQARRVVALWKDAKSPAPVEIEMPSGSQGVVVSLSVRRLEEWTADGRGDKRNAGYPMLSGIHPISVTI